jgi:thiol-disulfide isomerase/thioredoxin
MSRRSERSRGVPRRSATIEQRSVRLPLLAGGGLAVVVVLAALAALALSDESNAPSLAQPANVPVAVEGEALPTLTAGGADAARGWRIPVLRGTDLDGNPIEIGPGDGPMAIVVLAHWCSYCQSEVPQIVNYLDSIGAPEGVKVVAVTSSIDRNRPNYPPSTWLEREGWEVPTLIDDASSRGMAALGMTSFPSFVFVDGEGRVVHRAAGAIGTTAFQAALATLTP